MLSERNDFEKLFNDVFVGILSKPLVVVVPIEFNEKVCIEYWDPVQNRNGIRSLVFTLDGSSLLSMLYCQAMTTCTWSSGLTKDLGKISKVCEKKFLERIYALM